MTPEDQADQILQTCLSEDRKALRGILMRLFENISSLETFLGAVPVAAFLKACAEDTERRADQIEAERYSEAAQMIQEAFE